MKDINDIADYVFERWEKVGLFACSIGAYFSLNALKNRKIEDCMFVSPIVNLEHLINQMFVWFNVSEDMLHEKKEIETPDEPLRWDYYQYVKNNPVKIWDFPTSVLYAGKDNLQPKEIIEDFCQKHNCSLTVSENSEHPFMGIGDKELTENWFREKINY